MTNTNPISSNNLQIGGNDILLMMGPCSVENSEQIYAIAKSMRALGLRVIRGGAFKPRTSPHAFQGLGLYGLKILRQIADEFDLLVISEALGVEQLSMVAEYSDIIQIGSRNMQHFPLLWAVGEQPKPILLKRGFMSTIQEWFAAAEHITSRGNRQINLCERGIRGFDPSTRNVLDVNAIAYIKHPPTSRSLPTQATPRATLIWFQPPRAPLSRLAQMAYLWKSIRTPPPHSPMVTSPCPLSLRLPSWTMCAVSHLQWYTD